MEKHKDWWKTFFDDFRPVFPRATQRECTAEARYVMKKLGLKKGQKLLDCPCGFGRIALPLAKMGVKVTGVDITQSYLDEFATKARKQGVRVTLLKQDMRRITFKSAFDAAANLYTSIGYFDSDAEELKIFRRVFDALRPGGKFLLMTINRDWIILNFVSNNWEEIGGVRVLQKRRLDYSRSMMHDEWRFITDGAEKVHYTTLRLFAFHELRVMLEKVGFVGVDGFGRDDKPTGRKNRNLYVLASKPK